MINYYDQGYAARFANAENLLIEYQGVCSNILLELFGVGTIGSAQSYTSCADTCTGTPVTLGHTTMKCPHWAPTGTDCKTVSEIRNDLISQFGDGTTTLSRVACTGHALDLRVAFAFAHSIVLPIGDVTDTSNNNLADNVIRYERIYSILHEESHQLGAPDHYCYDRNSNNCNNPDEDCWRCDNKLDDEPLCVMTKPWEDLEARLNNGTLGEIYCSQCKSSTHSLGIVAHLDEHH